MRRFLIVTALMLVLIYALKYITYCALKYEFSGISFDAGFWTCIIIYLICEWAFKIKDRSKGGVVANIKVTVNDVNNEDEVAEAVGNGIKVFKAFMKLGSPRKEEESIDEDVPIEEVEPDNELNTDES